VTAFIVPGISRNSSLEAASLSEIHDNVFASAGIHPNEAAGCSPASMKGIAEILLRPRVVAVGETGLDRYHDRIPVQQQIELFKAHIRLAEAFGSALIVHSRSAEREVLDILGSGTSVPVILHCYTGTEEFAREAVEKGYFIGFAGPVTYRKNGYLRDLAGGLPAESVLIETDAPYLSPEPLRGRRNEPSNVRFIADVISGVWNLDIEATCGLLYQNSLRAFQLGPHRRTDLIYRLYGNTYMNITGKCNNRCRFCIREKADGVGGYYLKHNGEPEEKRLVSILENISTDIGEELVFCGYGEPTLRPSLLNRLAGIASRSGFKVRLNTNGTCPAWLSPDEVLDMLGSIDSVSISINAPGRDEYNGLCRPSDERAWENIFRFIDLARIVASVRLTAVRYPGVDMESVRKLARDLGLPFRERG
jgi:TatD DNase family protein